MSVSHITEMIMDLACRYCRLIIFGLMFEIVYGFYALTQEMDPLS